MWTIGSKFKVDFIFWVSFMEQDYYHEEYIS